MHQLLSVSTSRCVGEGAAALFRTAWTLGWLSIDVITRSLIFVNLQNASDKHLHFTSARNKVKMSAEKIYVLLLGAGMKKKLHKRSPCPSRVRSI